MSALRDFFDRQLSVSDEIRRHLGFGGDVSRQHLITHLIERTIRRASVDAATHRSAPISWKHCLMVAALTELRPLRLLARDDL